MKFLLAFILSPAFLILGACGAQVPSARRDDHSNSREWVKEDMEEGSGVQLHVALKLSNVDSASGYLLKLSNPASPDYARHWTAEQVAKRFSPHAERVRSVKDWLRRSGVPPGQLRFSHGGGHLQMSLTVAEVERIFNSTCYRLTSRATHDASVDCGPYVVPQSVSSAVDYVLVTERAAATLPDHGRRSKRAILDPVEPSFQNVDTVSSSQSTSLGCDSNKYMSPPCLRELYNMPEGSGEAHANNSFGVFQTSWSTWLADDLDLFFARYAPSRMGQRPVVEPINGGYIQTDYKLSVFNLEPNLDFQYTMALTGPQQPVTNVQVGDVLQIGNLNNMLAAFDEYYCGSLDPAVDNMYPGPNVTMPGTYNKTTDCGTARPPNVLSISYTWAEADYSPEYLARQCMELLKLGLMGVSVVVASGDTGTQSGLTPGYCVDADTGHNDADTGRHFSPQWPSACPWVTSVGGTQLRGNVNNQTHQDVQEEAWTYTSGNITLTTSGGFSRVFAPPEYQLGALALYQDREDPHLDNLAEWGYDDGRAGRGFPDVAAMASSYLIYLYGSLRVVHGTSAAAPLFASMVAMINNERLGAGKGPVGFLNPALYAHPEALNDVVVGINQGCGADPAFRAAKGWDAVTGLGSPDYERLRKIFVDLP